MIRVQIGGVKTKSHKLEGEMEPIGKMGLLLLFFFAVGPDPRAPWIMVAVTPILLIRFRFLGRLRQALADVFSGQDALRVAYTATNNAQIGKTANPDLMLEFDQVLDKSDQMVLMTDRSAHAPPAA